VEAVDCSDPYTDSTVTKYCLLFASPVTVHVVVVVEQPAAE